MGKTKVKQAEPVKAAKKNKDSLNHGGWWWSMSCSPRVDESSHWFQMIPIILFSAISILLVRMYSYERPMEQFYWAGNDNSQTDFFSHIKVVCIMIAAILALIVFLYRLVTQSFTLKKSYAYIPMAVYSIMVVISYTASDYKEFALWGYNDRFEGTIPLLAYMVMLFFVINMVNSERNVKQVLYPLLASATLLGLLGVSQATDHDFFRTALGQKLITPDLLQENGMTVHQMIDEAAARGEQVLSFTFQNKEIYQTVYNINYVSFYLTLLLPLVGLLFIRSVELWKEEAKWKPFVWGGLFALLLYNLIGSASSGGFFGMGIVVLLALVVLNKKILRWWKPVAMLLVITVAVGGITFERWSGEVGYAVDNVKGTDTVTASDETTVPQEQLTGHLDYFDTVGNEVKMSMDDKELSFTIDSSYYIVAAKDSSGNLVNLISHDDNGIYYTIEDNAFRNVILQPAADSDKNVYLIIKTNNPKEYDWNFKFTENGVLYLTSLGTVVDLDKIPASFLADKPTFGNGRGYIWSRTFPMMKSTVLKGFGADTYCLYFPQKDYVGKYNSKSLANNINIIVDKPHNLYLGAWIGTGGLSVLALLALWFIYIAQSAKIFIKKTFEKLNFTEICGIGTSLGITGFVFTGLVDDSTVSTMPMFYILLGMGIAINQMLKNTEI